MMQPLRMRVSVIGKVKRFSTGYVMFVTSITTSKMKTVKSSLLHHGRKLNLKSSHLTEAFARSVGFNTQGALLDDLQKTNAPNVVEFDRGQFFERLSYLSGLPEATLKTSQPHWPETAVTRGVGVNDLRSSSQLSGRTKERLERLFEMMATKGIEFYRIKGIRPAYDPNGLWFGSYRPGASAMRRAFLPPTPDMWETRDWTDLLAEDALKDNTFSYHELMEIARETHDAFSKDLKLNDVVFSAVEGLYVNHDAIEGCARSVLFQREGQLSDVKASDRDQRAKPSVNAA
ncbi:hypothetical protein [Thioclava sp. GXIMD4216]|uniref:hypothetical protein n=1 Tax=Thioclava sp. GXIMD4216 TaxID=3131929 RepID=UPI0030CF5C16